MGFLIVLPVFLYVALVIQERAFAQDLNIPRITIEPGGTRDDIPLMLQILFLLTILSLAPSILIMMTSFTRIVIVLSLVRNALGTQQLPPNAVIVGLAMFLTFFVMAPVAKDINDNALQPYLAGDMEFKDGLKKAEVSIRDFLYKQTRRKDLALMVNLAKIEKPKTKEDVPTYVLIPSFVISELKTAFQMGFVIYIPFLIIDMVVASTLMSMGMLFLPPILISLPFKILLFVMADGWHLIVGSLVKSFN
ncbi:flagellar type III secretion system pore protein FliP [bacterium]|nr:flagellar type III secretion system pore protein FliP [bacterium]MBU1025958.1 flagellar type III secretion system pore protein FliP [bacterium]